MQCLFLDRTAYLSQVLPKGVIRMPGGQIRSGIFNRRAASAMSGVESSAKARDNESVFTLRPCSYSAGFAKGVRLKDEGRTKK
jgi:hypothetical protein